MNYTEAVAYVHSRRRFSSTPGLERIKRITELCGDPQRGMRFIHIAGTNGKGSTSTMISNILTCAGYRTGLSTSPYITDFRERFRIDGKLIDETEFAAIMTDLKPLIEQLDKEGAEVNEFEVIVAVSLIWFKKRECDYVVLEVGLGGRFDATNVIDCPECAVITHIDLDHTDYLGDTVEKIATEKCGIIKDGCHVVAYPTQYDGAMEVIKTTCEQRRCNLTIPTIPDAKCDLSGCRFSYNGAEYFTPLVGQHQAKNAVTAIELARSIGIDRQCIAEGLKKAKIEARVEVISSDPVIILDGAHNPDGMSALRLVLDSFSDKKPVAIIGMLKDKDCLEALKMIAPALDTIITVGVNNPRSQTALELKAVADQCHEKVEASDSLEYALSLANSIKGERPLVICGSLYLAGEMRPILLKGD